MFVYAEHFLVFSVRRWFKSSRCCFIYMMKIYAAAAVEGEGKTMGRRAYTLGVVDSFQQLRAAQFFEQQAYRPLSDM
jgi:hypothetical protein